MKGYCYIALIIGFFVFYQQNPVYAIVIIVLFVGVYLFFKSRKAGGKSGIFGFFSGKATQQDNRMDDLITLMMIQQLLNSPTQDIDNRADEENTREKKKEIERVKQEVLDLLDD
ncbi:MAG: DUF308 domain-containing protein [Promethearchaeota archaeon]